MKLLWAFCLSSLLLTWSPLAISQAPHVMANNSQLDDLKLWVRLQGNNINPENAKWAGFANTAAKQGQLEILEYLHNLGVDFSQFDSFGDSTLHSASSSNKVNVVHWLLKSGIDPNLQKTVNHPTALHKAARYGASESVTLLLDAGADPLINSRSGTAFELADNLLVLHTLMAHWQKHGDGMPPPGLSPAAWWSFIGQPGRVPESLLRQDLHQAECNALHWAAASGHLPTLKRLLQLAPRATLSSPCFNKWTPLKIAIRFNQPEAVGELLNHWQSVDLQDVRLAVKYGSATLARVLYDSLEQEKDDLAFYPREGNAVLINYDPEDLAYLVNRRVISPAWLLNQIGSHGGEMLELAPLVVSQGVPITQVLRTGLRHDNPYLVQWALEQNPPLQQIDKTEPSPFMVAAKTGNTDLAKQLWHPDAVLGDDNYYERLEYFAAAGWTDKVLSFTNRRADLLTYALIEAVRYDNVDLLVDLVTAGVRAPRRRCRSVFDVAIRQSSLPTIELLAKTHAGNKECLSETVLSVIDNGDVAMLDPLLKHGANPNGTGDGYRNAVVRAVRDRKLVIL
ncbi:MAG: ankyrin repeat domain-containing protein, partial [Marinobacter sp.]|uniref:ankyrin repeat domain-containing protein n=1 Tax=Marinobacter sp. TaxID=50741 RepID=UPI0029C342C5